MGVSTRLAGTPQALGRSGACRVPRGTATACFRSRFEVSQLPTGPVGTMPVVTGMSGQSCTMAGAATFQTLKAASRKVTLPLGSGSEQCDDLRFCWLHLCDETVRSGVVRRSYSINPRVVRCIGFV